MPFIPIFIGVIVLGLVIGAGLSMLAKRTAPQVVAQAPSPQPTLAPVTPAPTERPLPEPTPAAEKATSAPEDTPTPASAREPTPKARRATHAPAAEPAPAPTPRPFASSKAVLPRAVPPLANASTAARATNAPASADDADSDFAKLAAGVVRQYIGAVARGDVPAAYGALGQSVPDNDANLPEIGVVDGNTRIRHIEARGSAEAAAVNVDMQGRSGLFFGQFTVHKTPSGAAIIVQHTLVKP